MPRVRSLNSCSAVSVCVLSDRSESAATARQLQNVLFKPTTSALAAAAAASAAASAAHGTAVAGPSGLFASSHAGGSGSSVTAAAQNAGSGSTAPAASVLDSSVEYGDVYVLSNRCAEDTLTPLASQQGYMTQSAFIKDETSILSSTAPSLLDHRLRLHDRLVDASQGPPKRVRLCKPIPPLVATANKEQREEFVRQLAGDTPLADLLRTAPQGLRGVPFLEEASLRCVPVVRACWFMKLVAAQPDFVQQPASTAATGTAQDAIGPLRAKVWTDDLRKVCDAALQDMSSCWRVSTGSSNSGAVSSGGNNSTLFTCKVGSDAAAGIALRAAEHRGISAPVLSLQAQLESCGLELLPAPAHNTNGVFAPSPEQRWIRAATRFSYALDLACLMWHDGLLARGSWCNWITDHLAQSSGATWSLFPAPMVRFVLVSHAVVRFGTRLAQGSRSLAHGIVRACRAIQEKFVACNTSSESLLPVAALTLLPTPSTMLQHAARTCCHLVRVMMRLMCTALPNTQGWLSAAPSLASSAAASATTSSATAAAAVLALASSRSGVHGWQWDWLGLPVPVASSTVADRDALLQSSPLAAFSGVLPLCSPVEQCWPALFPRFLAYLQNLSCSPELPRGSPVPGEPLSILPECSCTAELSASMVHPSQWQRTFPAATSPRAPQSCIDVFDADAYIEATSRIAAERKSRAENESATSSSSVTSESSIQAHFLRHLIPHFIRGPLQSLILWCIRGTPSHDRGGAVQLVASLLTHFVAPLMACASSASSTTSPSPSPLHQALLDFLTSFRPSNRVQLARITQLYALLARAHLFPMQAFIEQALCSGATEKPSDSGASQALDNVDLQSWPSLMQFYLRHLPMPLLHIPPSLPLETMLPSKVHSLLLRTEENQPNEVAVASAHLRTLHRVATGGRSEKMLARACDLVFLDVVWIWENQCVADTDCSGSDSPVLPEALALLSERRREGKHWTAEDRRAHTELWTQRCSAALLSHAFDFPSATLLPFRDSTSPNLGSTSQKRCGGPTLQSPSCSALALLASLPLSGAQLTADFLLRALQRCVENFASVEDKQRCQFLSSSAFLHVLSSFFTLLETLELHVTLQHALQWALDLLVHHLCPPMPEFEQVVFSSIRRNFRAAVCSGMDHSVRSRLEQIFRAGHSSHSEALAYARAMRLPEAIYAAWDVRAPWISSTVASPLSSKTKEDVDMSSEEGGWIPAVRSCLSSSSTPQQQQDDLARAASRVPLTAEGLASCGREILRSVLHSAIRMLLHPLGSSWRHKGYASEAQARVAGMRASWATAVALCAHVTRRVATKATKGSELDLAHEVVAAIVDACARLLSDTSSGVKQEHEANNPDSVASLCAELRLLFSAEEQSALHSASIFPAGMWGSLKPSSPATMHLLSCLALFLHALAASDLIGAGVGKILSRIATVAENSSSSVQQREGLMHLGLFLLGHAASESKSQMLRSSCDPMHLVRIHASITHEASSEATFPFIRFVVQQGSLAPDAHQDLLQAWLCSEPMQGLFRRHTKLFAMHVLPLLDSTPSLRSAVALSVLKEWSSEPACAEFIESFFHARDGHTVGDCAGVKMEDEPTTAIRHTNSSNDASRSFGAFAKFVAPWNASIAASMLDAVLRSRSEMDVAPFLKALVAPCLRASSWPSNSSQNPLSPLEYGARVEVIRTMLLHLPSSSSAAESVWTSIGEHMSHAALALVRAIRAAADKQQPSSSSPSNLDATCSCCCPSLLISTLLQAQIAQHSHDSEDDARPLPSVVLQLVEQQELLVFTGIKHANVVSSPQHGALLSVFRVTLLQRWACLRPCLAMIHASHPAHFARLLKAQLLALLLLPASMDDDVSENDDDALERTVQSSIATHVPASGRRFFPRMLQYFQLGLDVLHASSSASDPNSLLLELHALFKAISGNPGVAIRRRAEHALIAQCFELGVGTLDDIEDGSADATHLIHVPTTVSSQSAAPPSQPRRLNDPWLRMEGVSSVPLVDYAYENSVLA